MCLQTNSKHENFLTPVDSAGFERTALSNASGDTAEKIGIVEIINTLSKLMIKLPINNDSPLKTTTTQCCLCERDDAKIIGTGEDFEYRTSPDNFTAIQCRSCELVYLNPRPTFEEFERIYPPDYHAFEFSESEFGFVFKVRRKLEANRLLSWCKNLPEDARIIDIGCGDGFHLELLRDFGKKNWRLEGVDADERAVEMAVRKGLTVHQGLLENLDLKKDSYDLAILIQTLEHVAAPPQLLREIRSILRPGGQLVIVTDNTDSLDFTLSKKRYWGGYHFPRHWNLFNKKTIRRLAEKPGWKLKIDDSGKSGELGLFYSQPAD